MPDMTVRQVADLMGVSKEYIRKKAKKLPDGMTYKAEDGRTVMISEDGIALLKVPTADANKIPTVGSNGMPTVGTAEDVKTDKTAEDAEKDAPTADANGIPTDANKMPTVGANSTNLLVTVLQDHITFLKEQIAEKDRQIQDLTDALRTAQMISNVMRTKDALELPEPEKPKDKSTGKKSTWWSRVWGLDKGNPDQ